VFVAVAECRSFTLAADALGVSVSAASMQVRALEQYLGLPLFRRDGRLVELTDEARRLLPKVRDSLATLQDAVHEARVARSSGALYVSMLHSFLVQWLSSRLQDFQATHPEIDLNVEASQAPVDFNKTGVHAAIRLGKGNWPALHVEKLLDEWIVPVCRPDLLQKWGPINSADDLTRYRLLHSTTEPWIAWRSGCFSPGSWPETGLGVDDSAAIVQLAVSGAGLALARWSLIGDEVRRGQLAVASRTVTRYELSYYFVCLPRVRGLRKVVAFRDWIFAQAAGFPVPP
jgi:LysR family transcriptional regulator, glycine cleavage system transcriptional activator